MLGQSGQFDYRAVALTFSSQEGNEAVEKKVEDFLIKQTELENFEWSVTSTFSYVVGSTVNVVFIFKTPREEP